MEDRKKADFDRIFLEIESLIEKEKQEKEFNLENICDLSVTLKNLGSYLSKIIHYRYRTMITPMITKEERIDLLKLSELYYDKSKKIKDYINLTLIKKLIDMETENVKQEVLKVKSIENLIIFIKYLDINICNKEDIEKAYKLYSERRKKFEESINNN